MEILGEMKIKESVKLHKLDRFRKTKNSANYQGYKVSLEQAKEIMDFWSSCIEEMIRKIEEFTR